jgi:hypothetical protein
VRELIQQGTCSLNDNPWKRKFVKYFIGNNSDLINVRSFRKKFGLNSNERFEVQMAKVICEKKIEMGILERDIDVSLQHALFVVKRMQSNTPKQVDTLMTFLYNIPTDEGVALIKILLEKEKAFTKEVLEWMK